MLNNPQFLASLPLLLSSALAVLVMIAIAVHRCHSTVATITLAGLLVTFASLFCAQAAGSQTLGMLFVVDNHALFYAGLILLAAMACTLLMRSYFAAATINREEAYLLLTLSVAGALLLVSSRHLASFFVALELMSIPLYGLTGYLFRQRRSLESATKYLVLSAAATAFLLFGMALLYAQSGRLDFAGVTALPGSGGAFGDWLTQAALVLLFAGIAFKLSLAPFHAWTADVYEGAPAPVGAFLATVSKIAVVAVLLRLFAGAGASGGGAAGAATPAWPELMAVLAVIAGVSILVGNLLALRQDNIKRLLAYSSIAHFGYLLIVLIVAGELMAEAAGMYLVTYCATTLVAFGVLSALSSAGADRDTETLHGLRALASRSPALALALSLALLSLAGIPLTAGFIGKFYVLAAGADAGRWDLLLLVVLGSAIGLWYYLRVVAALYARPEPGVPVAPVRIGAAGFAIAGALAVVIVVGLWPQPLISLLGEIGLAAASR